MNVVFKVYWNNPIEMATEAGTQQLTFEVPLGAIISNPSNPTTTYIDEGTKLFFTEDRVRQTVLTGLDTSTSTPVLATDQLLPSIGKLQAQIDLKADAASVNQSLSTKADLVGGLIPASQLPSYVDDVLSFPDLISFPSLGEDAKIYIAEDVNKTYRWGGSSYVEIAGGVALGETSSTAYRGDRGKIAYDHSLSQGNPHNTTTSDINEGTKLFFTEPRVRNTVLSDLVKTNSSNVTNTDTIEVAVGKLAAKSEAGSTVNWVDANTLTGYNKLAIVTAESTKVQFAKINGFIWMRGHITLSSSVNANGVLFSFTDSRFLWDNTYQGSRPDNQTTYDRVIHNNIKIQDLAEFRLLARQIGTGTAGNITNTVRIIAAVNITSDINYAIIEPVCLGIAKNP